MSDKKWFNSLFNSNTNQDLSSRTNHHHDLINQDIPSYNKHYEKNLIVIFIV